MKQDQVISTTIKRANGTLETIGLPAIFGDMEVGASGDSSGSIINGDFDANGFLIDWDKYGGTCVRILEVELALLDLDKGDEFDQLVAAKARKHANLFAMLVPGHPNYKMEDLEAPQYLLVQRNRPVNLQFTSGWLGGMDFQPFYPETTQVVDQAFTDEQQPKRGAPAMGIVTPVLGWSPWDDYKDAGKEYVIDLIADADRRRRAAGRAEAGIKGPVASPGKPTG
jgi:hypothetical protein